MKKLKKILLAEDEADIRAIAKIALEEIAGFEVMYCKNGLEMLEATKTFNPDLLLLDVMMPEMDGPTSLKILRNNPEFKNIPAVFMTAKIQSDEIANYKEMGIVNVINKPFDPLTLGNELNKIWDTINEKFNSR